MSRQQQQLQQHWDSRPCCFDCHVRNAQLQVIQQSLRAPVRLLQLLPWICQVLLLLLPLIVVAGVLVQQAIQWHLRAPAELL
jgi:hypothetical protein